MKIIKFEDIASMGISPVTCYNWVNELLINKANIILPPKISMKFSSLLDGRFCNVMPCIIPGEYSPLDYSVGGVKIVTRYPNREPALESILILFNADSGEELALLNADWITAMRTGAVAAHSIKLLARENFSNIAIMGLGNTARAVLLVLAELYKRDLQIKLLRYKSQEDLFITRFAGYKNLKYECVSDYNDLMWNSDVIISAVTYADKDFCADNEIFSPGVLVLPVHTRGFTNCDLIFDKIFADDYGHVKHFKNFAGFKYFAEVSDILTGKSPGRESNQERILAYNIGIAAHDINFAANIYKLCRNNINIDINMKGSSSKFWL